MRTIITTFLLTVLLTLTSCSRREHTAIVGRWHEVGTKGLMVLHEDNTVEISIGGNGLSGKYGFITDKKLKLELIAKGGAPLGPRVYQFAVSGDKMTLTDMDGQTSEYVREK